MFPTDLSIRPDDLARATEERAFDSLWFPEHTHIPVSRLTPAPAGEPLAEEYYRSLDPFVALMAAASVTERIRLGTGIALVAQRDPITAAKEIATLDLLSGGRFAYGIGYGWNKEELADHGVAFTERRAVVRERVLAMQRLWEDEQASFEGEHLSFSPTFQWPKPLQEPGPPVLLGGSPGPKLFAAVAEFCDGWIPIGAAGIREALPDLERALEERGRRLADLEIVPFGSEASAEKLDYFESIGITEVVFRVPPAPADVVLPILDRQAAIIASRT
jgi:probable F420-dependent oxidoreductase